MARNKGQATKKTSGSGRQASSIEVVRVTHESLRFHVIGTSPFVCNAMSAKVQQQLLLPPKKKTRMEKETTLKHDPLEEFRRSAYRSRDNKSETRILFKSAGFKRSMGAAALDLPGTKKAEIERLCWALGTYVPIFGIQQLWMTVVRQADMARTPDVRSRAIIPEWASTFTIDYVTPNLNRQAVANLVASAGVFIGVGDGRPQRGALSMGRFEIVPENDLRYQRIVKAGGRRAQDAAFKEPTCYDLETEELLEWWMAESKRRGFEVA